MFTVGSFKRHELSIREQRRGWLYKEVAFVLFSREEQVFQGMASDEFDVCLSTNGKELETFLCSKPVQDIHTTYSQESLTDHDASGGSDTVLLKAMFATVCL